MTFFERYFAALDGPDPHSSLDIVADDVEFSIQWAAGPERRSTQMLGGKDDLRAFIDAGDMAGWSHHIVRCVAEGDSEFVLGETRYDSGEYIGTFLAVAQLDEHGRMVRYMVARSPAISFEQVLGNAREH